MVWSAAAFVATRAVSFAATAALARLLVPREFGVVAAVLIFVGFIELISEIGMKATVVYEQDEGGPMRLHVAFTLNVALALGLAGAGFVLAPATAAFFDLGDHVGLFRLAALNPLLIGLGNVHDATLMRDLKFRRRMVPEIVRSLVKAAVAIILAALGFGASALVIGLLVGSLAWTATLWVLTSYRPKLRLNGSVARELLRYGLPASALQIVAVVSGRVDVIVIGRMLGEQALGLYSVAFRVPELLIEGISWTVSQVAFPSFARERVRNSVGVGAMTADIMRWQALYALPTAAALAVLAPSVIVVLFGPAWRDAAGVLSGIAVATAIAAVTFPIGDVFKAVAKQRVLLRLHLVGFPIFVVTLVLVAPAGIVTLAWTRVGTRLLWGVALTASAVRTLGMSPRPLVAALGPGAAAAFGVTLGATAVRFWWPPAAIGPLIAGAVAGGAGGALALRLLAPGTFQEVRYLVPGRRPT